MSFISKINSLIKSNKLKEIVEEVDGVHVWIVSWNRRTGDYSRDISRTAKAFINEEDANLFADSLQMAQDLLQNTNNLCIKIEKQR